MRQFFFRLLQIIPVLYLTTGCHHTQNPKTDVVEIVLKPGREPEETTFRDWETLGAGTAFIQSAHPTGTDVALVFAGWSVSMPHTQQWATALWHQKLGALGVGRLYAVQGPDDPLYPQDEWATRLLAEHLVAQLRQQGAFRIFVIAHSSGAFVAHQFFQHLLTMGESAAQTAQGKIHYYNLDGGIGSGRTALTPQVAAFLAKIRAISVEDPTTQSRAANAEDMEAIAQQFPNQAMFRLLQTTDSGCEAHAKWCLHDVLITKHPANPKSFDLVRDYGELGQPERPVQTDYLDLE